MNLEYGAPRIKAFDEKGNEASLEDALDQLEEARDVALLHSAKYSSHFGDTTPTHPRPGI
jgi:hypothetical protein